MLTERDRNVAVRSRTHDRRRDGSEHRAHGPPKRKRTERSGDCQNRDDNNNEACPLQSLLRPRGRKTFERPMRTSSMRGVAWQIMAERRTLPTAF